MRSKGSKLAQIGRWSPRIDVCLWPVSDIARWDAATQWNPISFHLCSPEQLVAFRRRIGTIGAEILQRMIAEAEQHAPLTSALGSPRVYSLAAHAWPSRARQVAI